MSNELQQLKEKLLKNKNFKKKFNKWDLSFEIAESIIDARIKNGITQKELADMMGTKQPAIARMESGKHGFNIKNIEKIAEVLNIKTINPLLLEKKFTSVKEKLPVFTFPSKWLVSSNSMTNSNTIVEQTIIVKNGSNYRNSSTEII